MNRFIRITESLSIFLGIIAAILLVIAVVVVCQMVFVRFVLNLSTSWQTEFVSYALIASTFIGSPYVLLNRGHVFVELIPMMLGDKGRFYLALFAYSASALFCITMAYLSIEFWYESWTENWSSDTIWEPKLWKAYISMPIGFTVISMQYIADLLCLINGRDAPFGLEYK
ncbi:MAG: TRAP transporter small permease [Gammaproteobacteria bacterium]|nr:TRAP transporter small permease [Gammaproteobacteria bacterium]MDX2488725.1 TRAP transporter small permease [Gammaproteobacteria bacterium]